MKSKLDRFLANPSGYSSTSLDLSNKNITDKIAQQIGEAIKSNTTLITLSLDNNQIGDAGAAAIAEAIKSNTTVTTLYLNTNQIGDAGAAAIAEAIKSNTTVTTLYLNTNQIGDAGAAAIAEAIKSNTTVTKLYLQNNQMGDAGVAKLETYGHRIQLCDQIPVQKMQEQQELDKKHFDMFMTVFNDDSYTIKGWVQDKEFDMSSQDVSGRTILWYAVFFGRVDLVKELLLSRDIDLSLEDKKGVSVLGLLYKNSDFQEISDTLQANAELRQEVSDLISEGNNRLQLEDERGVILLGKTGSGKSTLSHLLSGRELQAIHDDETFALIVDALQPLDDIKISHNRVSETKIPNKCNNGNVVIWDCPGFYDTAGTAQEIANAFYIKMILEKTSQLKFVLVVEDLMVTSGGRGTSFIEIVNQLVKTFVDIKPLQGSISLVVTQSPNGKKPEHIINSIDRILTQNNNIDDSVKEMMEYLKHSVYIFHSPVAEGPLSPPDIWDEIEKSTKYMDGNPNLANMSISEKSAKDAESLLQAEQVYLKNLLELILKSVKESINYLGSSFENSVFSERYNFIKKHLPKSIVYEQSQNYDPSNYFLNLELLSDLKNSINIEQVDSFEGALPYIKSLLSVFEKYTVNQSQKILQDYSYMLSQQFEYIKFFSDLCKEKDPDYKDNINLWIKRCNDVLNHNIEDAVKTTQLDGNIEDPKYYHELLKYLNKYPDSEECKVLKLKSYIALGELSEKNDNSDKALEYYLDAIKLKLDVPEIYNKVGDFLASKKYYNEAIKYYKVVNNSFGIKQCFKEWLKLDPKNPEIMMKKADHLKSIGVFDSAIKYYNHAFGLSSDKDFKNVTLKNIIDTLNYNINSVLDYEQMANDENYFNFDLVTDDFTDSLSSTLSGSITSNDDY